VRVHCRRARQVAPVCKMRVQDACALQAGKAGGPRLPKMPQLQDFQFYDTNRLTQVGRHGRRLCMSLFGCALMRVHVAAFLCALVAALLCAPLHVPAACLRHARGWRKTRVAGVCPQTHSALPLVESTGTARPSHAATCALPCCMPLCAVV